jgi:hypothetical protein
LILDSILQSKGEVSETDFAFRLQQWINNGLLELGDTKGVGCGETIRTVAGSGLFPIDPRRVFAKSFSRSDIQRRQKSFGKRVEANLHQMEP